VSPILCRQDRAGAGREGRTLVAILFWIVGLGLMGRPFLRAADTTGWIDWSAVDRERWSEIDPGRNPETDVPFQVDLADFDATFAEGLGATLAQHVEDGLEKWYATDSPRLKASGVIQLSRLPAGQKQFLAECAGCHGPEGDGGGPAARYLEPRPRNFFKGLFKFTSTDTGVRPKRKDLYRTVSRGLSGSAMPPFALMTEERRWDIVEYVRFLALRGEFRQMMLDEAWDREELPDGDEIAGIINERWHPSGLVAVFPSASEPVSDAASIERGRELFLDKSRATCFTCHGETGRGDGPTAFDYEDDWGYPIRPRDFTTGVFRVGQEGQDLYMSIATGIGGTPMGSFSHVLEPREIWDLVHFVQSLGGGRAAQ